MRVISRVLFAHSSSRAVSRSQAALTRSRSCTRSRAAPNSLRVVDVFDTHANFESFGKTLVPILEAMGVDVGKPDIIEVHNIIRG